MIAGLIAFAGFYAIANRFQLVNSVLYRAAADDWVNAAWNFATLAVQAAALLGAVIFLPKKWFWAALVLIALSVMPNLGFGQTVGGMLGAAELGWLFAEARQAGHAAGEFAGSFVLVAIQLIAAIALLIAARKMLAAPERAGAFIGTALFIIPSLLITNPLGAERNAYSYLAGLAFAEAPPARARVTLEPQMDGAPQHIIWLVDESVAYEPFQRLLMPKLLEMDVTNFGPAASMGNCSAPSNVALRSGVDVRNAGPETDLRATPSIWTYAHKAGYKTSLIDGQTRGAPQNLLLDPERALIDDYQGAGGDLDVDDRIAVMLNASIKDDRKSFTYVVLRGVHFQYRDHYPKGAIPEDSPRQLKYETALEYSKHDFFKRLLDGVDRSKVAIAYLSDHGQNLESGKLAHCTSDPGADEFRIPLLAFLPPDLQARYDNRAIGERSVSQLFPATLGWMGYDRAAVDQAYDNDLDQIPARYVWFGRNVIPMTRGDTIEVTAGSAFPGSDK